MQRVERERDVTLKNIRIFELILNNIFFRLIILDFEFQIFNIAIPILDKYTIVSYFSDLELFHYVSLHSYAILLLIMDH